MVDSSWNERQGWRNREREKLKQVDNVERNFEDFFGSINSLSLSLIYVMSKREDTLIVIIIVVRILQNGVIASFALTRELSFRRCIFPPAPLTTVHR